MLSNPQFERTRRLALSLAGIELVERHRELLVRRSRRAGIVDAAGLDSLLQAAEAGETTATQRLVVLLTTKFTGFFRHPRHFDVAVEHARRAVQRRGKARLWSAGAATGEEPYSLAMALVEGFQREEPPVDIVATDLDAEALRVAGCGEYGEAALRPLTPERRERFFRRTSSVQRLAVAPAVRKLVEFMTLNLTATTWAIEGRFDVIFCRNVLMYLEARLRAVVLERMASIMVPGGLLLLDPTEHPGKAGHLFAPGSDGMYLLRANASSKQPEFSTVNEVGL